MIKRTLLRLHRDEDGAVTVGWVVLLAATCLLALAAGLSVGRAATGPARDIGAFIATVDVEAQG